MPVFQYTARNDDGQLISDKLAFRDEITLRHHLRKNNLFVLEVAERRKTRIQMSRKVRLGDLVIMTRQLRTMIQAGMPLVSGLEALAEQSTNPTLGEILTEVERSVSSGRSLASALGDYPQVFPELLITLIQSGEISGRLPEALLEASRQLELQLEVRQKLVTALMYPAFTLLATIATLTAMILWIVPVFAGIYKDLNATLPAPTLLLVQISDVLTHQSWIVILTVIALIVALRRFYKTPEGRYKIDAFKLKIPLFGAIFRKSAAANVTGSLAGLLDSGVPLIQAMHACARVCGNAVMAESVRTAADNVETGRRLSDELERTEQFQIMVVRMISMAEETGSLPEVMRQISASYIEEVEYSIRRIMTIIEPVMILCVGGIVGFMLVALYYPIFNLGNAFLHSA
ncbi:MAG: type secretion system protein [Chthonomonadaceae bacterium]|nr:type secretion system protein [Chthonomonadaceae bacterium]